jgi:hypothetical protein
MQPRVDDGDRHVVQGRSEVPTVQVKGMSKGRNRPARSNTAPATRSAAQKLARTAPQ